jgi:uncharacterized protein (TIGR03067 family)
MSKTTKPEEQRPDKTNGRRPESLSETVFKQLQGEWQVVYTEINGEMAPLTEKVVLTHRGNNFTVAKNGKVAYEGRFAVDVTKMPYEVALTFTKSSFEGNLGGPRVGIALLAGDTLKTVFGPVGLPINPKAGFQSFPDSDRVLTIHQRVGAERGTGPTVSPTRSVAVW